MPRASQALKLYIGGAAVSASAFLLLVFFRRGIGGGGEAWALTAAFALLLAVGGMFPVPLSSKIKLEVTTPVLFASVLLLSPPQAMLVGGVGRGIAALGRRLPWYNTLFNASEAVLGMGIAGVAFSALSPYSFLHGVEVSGILGAGVAAPVLYLENTLAVALVVGLRLKQNPLKLWRQGREKDLMPEGTLYILGFLASLLVAEHAWSLALLPLPVVIIYFAFKDKLEKAFLNEKLREQMEELRLTQAQLIQAAKMASVGTLAAGVAHEINNPIFVISGNAELLLAENGAYFRSDKAKKLVVTIREMSERISRIVNSLLTYSRNKEEKEWVDINEAIENTLQLVGKSLQLGSIVTVKDFSYPVPPVMGKRSQIEQVVMNIVTNARDAMHEGGKLTISTGVEGNWVGVSIADTGVGIPSENLPKIFDPFFTTKEPGKGTGLGLYISLRIMDGHGGRIEVQSTPGKGSTFFLRFPLLKQERREVLASSPSGASRNDNPHP